MQGRADPGGWCRRLGGAGVWRRLFGGRASRSSRMQLRRAIRRVTPLAGMRVSLEGGVGLIEVPLQHRHLPLRLPLRRPGCAARCSWLGWVAPRGQIVVERWRARLPRGGRLCPPARRVCAS